MSVLLEVPDSSILQSTYNGNDLLLGNDLREMDITK